MTIFPSITSKKQRFFSCCDGTVENWATSRCGFQRPEVVCLF